jgi:hypothetical protein
VCSSDLGMKVLGVDPAKEIANCATENGIETLPNYFTSDLAKTIRLTWGKAKFIISNNVLANIDNLEDVVEGIKELLDADGIFSFETSYLLDVVERGLIDTIFSEHVSYFSVKPLCAFFARHGLQLIDAERTKPKGGSLRCLVQLAGGPHPVSPNVAELIELEELSGLNHLVVYRRLGWRLQNLKTQLQAIVIDANQHGQTIAAWGAADGPTTMIFYFGLGPYLRYLIDDNPQKISLFSPGWHLPVLSSKALVTSKPDMVLLLAWRYAEQIMRAHPNYLRQGGRWVIPLPEVKVLG